MTHKIYLSYEGQDGKLAKDLQENLVRAGFRPWIDQNPRPGQDWRFAMDEAIQQSDAVITILTPHAANSAYVTYEWAYALGLGVPVIPVMFKRGDYHPRLMSLEIMDATVWNDPAHFWDYLVRELPRRLRQVETSPPRQNPVAAQAPTYQQNVMPQSSGNWLVIRRGPNLNKMYSLRGNTVVLGRDPGNDIAIDDQEVSRKHFKLTRKGTHYSIEDLQSTNGTMVNGRYVSGSQLLEAGDAIALGESILLSYEVVP